MYKILSFDKFYINSIYHFTFNNNNNNNNNKQQIFFVSFLTFTALNTAILPKIMR